MPITFGPTIGLLHLPC